MIKLRYQRLSDAKRFFEILNNPNFKYFNVKPKTVDEEKKFLKMNTQKRKDNFEYNYSIIYNGKMVGGAGIKINQHRNHIGEIGYFVAEEFWGRGIATKVSGLLEKIAFGKLRLKRLEIVMDPKNKASQRVAIKCGYKKEGLMKKVIENKGKLTDVYMYAKVR